MNAKDEGQQWHYEVHPNFGWNWLMKPDGERLCWLPSPEPRLLDVLNVLQQQVTELLEWQKDAIEIVKRLCYGASLEAMVQLLRGSEESMKWLEEHDPQGALRYRTMWQRNALTSPSTIAHACCCPDCENYCPVHQPELWATHNPIAQEEQR